MRLRVARGPGILGSVQRHGLADECFERKLDDLVTFMEVDCTPCVAFETRVEELLGILYLGTSEKSQFDDVVVCLSRAD